MNEPLILDSGPLGQIAHPKPNLEVDTRFRQLAVSGRVIVIPEIADYEVCRSLILAGLSASLARLDSLKQSLIY